MFRTILVATDGAPGTESAVARALDLARAFESTVHALSVVDTRGEPDGLSAEQRDELRAPAEERARAAIDDVSTRAEDLGIETVGERRAGAPFQAILEYAREHEIDLVVMATRATTDAEYHRLGSTTERVVSRAEVPVLAVPVTEPTEVPESAHSYDHVVVPTDGSGPAERAGERTMDVAERYGAAVHVVYVVDESVHHLQDAPGSIVGLLKEGGRNAVEAVASDARERGLSVETHVLRGVPETEILQYADGVDADLVAMGTRGRTASGNRMLGSTTARVVRRAGRPVLTVN